MTQKKLLSEFPPVSKEEWVKKATEDLKGTEFDKKLVWRTYENFPVQPFYTQEDMGSRILTDNLYKAFKKDPDSQDARNWVNFAEIRVDNSVQANADALDALEKRGADGLLFTFGGCQCEEPDFGTLLKGIHVENISVSFRKAPCAVKLAKAYFAYLESKKADLKKINGYIQCDPIGRWTLNGQEPNYKNVAELVRTTDKAPGFYGLTLCSGPFVNAGANYTQELAFTLAKLTDYIEKLSGEGITAKQVFQNALPMMALNTDYFFEIAKFRALRALLIEFAGLYETGLAPEDIKIAAETSVWAMAEYDPNVNMLRSTTAAMSAILGGADTLFIAPYDATFGTPTAFSRRIALNISHLIKEESYFDKVVDPAAGSYYIENLTQTLIEKALELFKATEAAGGFVSQFAAGEIQKQIAGVRSAKQKDIAMRRQNYVGVNRYPNLKETLGEKKEKTACCCGKADGSVIETLPQEHAAEAFETMREKTEAFTKQTGRRPKVYMAGFGNLAMRTARVMFSSDFFGTAGFEILPEALFDDVKTAAETSAKADADIVVICSSDDDYMESALEFVKTFKAIAPDKQLVLAGNPAEITESLDAAGLDGYIHVRVNALDCLTGFQKKFGIN